MFHGIFLVAVGVLPQIILDQHAGDRFRHSMQGLFVMLTGSGRVLANPVAGHVASHGLGLVYWCAAALCLVAAGLILLAYREPARATQPIRDKDQPVGEPPVTPVPAEAG